MAVWDRWVPGVLSKNQLIELCSSGFISGVNGPGSIDDSAIDLHVTDEAYRLVKGSVKPFGRGFLQPVLDQGLARRIEPDSNGSFVLEPRATYLFALRERIETDGGGSLYGQATAKSTIGRLDVLARLIVDGMDHYEAFNPKAIKSGVAAMYLEVTPITFPIAVRAGDSLTQLRLFFGRPDDCEVTGPEIARTCFAGEGRDHHLRVDLTPTSICGVHGCGFRARTPSSPSEPIPLRVEPGASRPDPSKWWELVRADEHGLLTIAKSHFYILRSKERLSLPSGIAVYARAIDEEIGEMRIHYAGFAHPFFGLDRSDGLHGTPLIFEVRGHDVDVSLRDNEVLARLRFFRMSADAVQEPKAEKPRQRTKDDYNEQDLKLSKCFADWSTAPMLADV